MPTFNLPDLGEGLAEAEIVKWLVKEGDAVKLDQPMLQVETAKAVVEVPSPYTGVIRTLHAKDGDIVETGKPLVEFDIGGANGATAAKPHAAAAQAIEHKGSSAAIAPAAPASAADSASADRVRAAPAMRALAKKLGVDINGLRGSGRGGLITADDIMGSTVRVPSPSAQVKPAAPATAKPAAPVVNGAPEQLRGLRRGMAHSMSQSRDSVANCTLFDDADLHAWIRKTDYTSRLLRAIACAAREVPALNAHYDGEKMTRTLQQRVDIAIAVDTPEGLIVPTIRDVANKDARQLREEVRGIKEAAKTRTVPPEALKDFTFMLSNFGMLAGRYATPLVVPPAVAILGAGGLRHDVVAVMGGIEAHLRLPLSLTFDHRCITGGEAARFLAAVIEDLQQAD